MAKCSKCGEKLTIDYETEKPDAGAAGTFVDSDDSRFCSDGTIHHAEW